MIIKQLSVFLENKTGRIKNVTKLLGDAGINLAAFSLAESSDFGILKAIASDPIKAEKVLKENEYTVTLNDVVCLYVDNTPGKLAEALEIISKNDISIDYMYAFAVGDMARVVIKPNDVNKCIKVLNESDLKLMKASDFYKL